MAENVFMDSPKNVQKPKSVKHIKMQVIKDLKSIPITNIVKEQVDKSAQLITNDSTSYHKLKKNVQSHEATVVVPDMTPSLLPWVHVAISNAKRLLLGTP